MHVLCPPAVLMRGHPQYHGAQPFQYRFGAAVGNSKVFSSREPELAHEPSYPYHSDQYARDVREWVAATGIEPKRHGRMRIVALGGAARRISDDLETEERQYGVDVPDGNGGYYNISSVEFILRVLEDHPPVHQEARLVRIGFDFFQFIPRRDERCDVRSQSFDDQLEEANRAAGF